MIPASTPVDDHEHEVIEFNSAVLVEIGGAALVALGVHDLFAFNIDWLSAVRVHPNKLFTKIDR